MTPFPTLRYEKKLWNNDCLAIGVDEVGRGAFAGPLYTAAVSLKPIKTPTQRKKLESLGIHDSKKLTAKKRESLCNDMQDHVLGYAFGIVDVDEINSIGITAANQLAMLRSITELIDKLDTQYPLHLLSDAFYVPNIPSLPYDKQTPIVHGDSLCMSIAAASIFAKVERDKCMKELSKSHPEYGWDTNKGYGTKFHLLALKNHGPTGHHRSVFIDHLGL